MDVNRPNPLLLSESKTMEIKDTTAKLTVSNANLEGSTFHDVSLQGSSFDDINFSEARLNNVTLKNTEITDCCIEGLRINGVLISDLLEIAAH